MLSQASTLRAAPRIDYSRRSDLERTALVISSSCFRQPPFARHMCTPCGRQRKSETKRDVWPGIWMITRIMASVSCGDHNVSSQISDLRPAEVVFRLRLAANPVPCFSYSRIALQNVRLLKRRAILHLVRFDEHLFASLLPEYKNSAAPLLNQSV